MISLKFIKLLKLILNYIISFSVLQMEFIMKKEIIVSGITATGKLTIGNY